MQSCTDLHSQLFEVGFLLDHRPPWPCPYQKRIEQTFILTKLCVACMMRLDRQSVKCTFFAIVYVCYDVLAFSFESSMFLDRAEIHPHRTRALAQLTGSNLDAFAYIAC